MTEQWKPEQHDRDCEVMLWGGNHCCDCNGTRWSGYGERVGDCAAVYRLCQIYGAYREADMTDLIREMADDLRVAVAMEYPPGTHNFPSQKRRFDQSMDVVRRAEAMLSASRRERGAE